MLKVGLTGGIATGKSVVGEMFVKLGAHLILADSISHWLMQPGHAVYNQVVDRFGREILSPDGTINRPRLAEVAFGNASNGIPARVKELNAIVHPAVLEYEDEWMQEIGENDSHAIAIVEAALILEAGGASRFARLIVVTCTAEQRIARYAQRMKISEADARAEVTRRMAAQIPDAEKLKVADFVIDNSGSLDSTEDQVREVYAKLQAQEAQSH